MTPQEIELIARACHQVNKAYCMGIGDDSQLPWEEAPEWQRKSAINGVIFHLDNPDVTPEQSHESWMKEKAEEGWKFAETKNVEEKEHPCFLPYAELPKEHKVKDFLFKETVATVKTVLEAGSGEKSATTIVPVDADTTITDSIDATTTVVESAVADTTVGEELVEATTTEMPQSNGPVEN